ncbi:hypothetical protein AaE_010024, partial [Aphanomyces astaci]
MDVPRREAPAVGHGAVDTPLIGVQVDVQAGRCARVRGILGYVEADAAGADDGHA